MAAGKKKRRPKGDGSLQRLSKDRFRVQITVGYDQDGRQIRRSYTGKSQNEAVRKLNELKAEQTAGRLVPASNTTFSEFADRWLQTKQCHTKAKTYSSYEHAVHKHLTPAFGHYKLQKLTTAQINDYFSLKSRSGLSAATLRQHRAVLHGIMLLASTEGLITQNPVKLATSLPQTRHQYNILTGDEISRLLNAARQRRPKPGARLNCLYYIILLALATGLRRGELLALRWANIDLKANTIDIRENLVEIAGKQVLDTPKSANSRRTISVDRQVLSVLRELWQNDNGPLFRSANGGYIPFSTLGRLFRQLLKQAEINKPLRFHDLRHTHVTHLLAEGYDLKMISKRIGDDVRTALYIYAHALPEKDRTAAEFIGKKLFI